MRARVYPFAPPPNGSDRDRARRLVREIRRDIAPPMRRWRVKAWLRDHWLHLALLTIPALVVWLAIP